ncbi:MAG: DUF2744 domain-containing protein [Bowdeniella nasicola]|nr:DUF2744 domain-containing protein [Bowdeniella nasicola]
MIPLQKNMNMDDPEEHILWALVNIGGNIDAPLLMPERVLRRWAHHLWECGFRHHPELQMRFYQPPRDGAGVFEAGGGTWVPAPAPGVEPDAPDPVDDLLGELTPAQRAALATRLTVRGDGDDDS